MVFRRLGPWSLALGVLIGAGPSVCLASGINMTGHVETDFPSSDQSTAIFKVNSNPTDIGQSPWITNNGWVSGWSIKDIRLSYDQARDVLYVGVNNWAGPNGIAPFGQANGDPSGTPQAYDPAHLGYGTPNSDKSVALIFAADNPNDSKNPGTPLIIAGIPADKSQSGIGTNGYTISTVDSTRADSGLGYMFGKSLMGMGPNDLIGNLAYDPSPSHPQLEFSIGNFSKVADPEKGFWISAYAGSGLDGVAGESHLGWIRVPNLVPQTIPEPSTVLAWALVSGGIAWRARSRKRKTA